MGLTKPHAVFIPFPAQGHINPMQQLAKLLHYKGFHITFVNTEVTHKRLINSLGANSLDGLPTFRFETIPDGLPATHPRDVPSLCVATNKTGLGPFRELLKKLSSSPNSPPVTCIIADGVMTFTLDAAHELGIPEVLFWTTSACGFLAYAQYHRLIEEGLTPLKDESHFTNGYLDTVVDYWLPGMKDIRLKDIPSFIRTTDPNDVMLEFMVGETELTKKASAVVLNTFESFEQEALDAISSLFPPTYSVGPLNLLFSQIPADNELKAIASSLWTEDTECLDWLDTKEPNSVVYVNFGSTTVMTNEQLVEFSWGLANSNKTFLWIIRPGLVAGDTAVVPPEFLEETEGRGKLASWCPQEQVLTHPAIGGFLTHSGWNSTLESLCGGVPMICWPFFAEQQTNCRYACKHWGIGIEIEDEVKRDYIEGLVRRLMEGEEGKEMRKNALGWKKKMEKATSPKGSSVLDLDNLINQVLVAP